MMMQHGTRHVLRLLSFISIASLHLSSVRMMFYTHKSFNLRFLVPVLCYHGLQTQSRK